MTMCHIIWSFWKVIKSVMLNMMPWTHFCQRCRNKPQCFGRRRPYGLYLWSPSTKSPINSPLNRLKNVSSQATGWVFVSCSVVYSRQATSLSTEAPQCELYHTAASLLLVRNLLYQGFTIRSFSSRLALIPSQLFCIVSTSELNLPWLPRLRSSGSKSSDWIKSPPFDSACIFVRRPDCHEIADFSEDCTPLMLVFQWFRPIWSPLSKLFSCWMPLPQR